MKAKSNGKLREIKIIPADRILESQDPSKEYYQVLMKSESGYEISCLTGNGTIEEVEEFIKKNFETKGQTLLNEDKIQMVIEELEKDKEFLKKEVHKKNQEIAIHVQDAIELLYKMYDYESKGLPDMEIVEND